MGAPLIKQTLIKIQVMENLSIHTKQTELRCNPALVKLG